MGVKEYAKQLEEKGAATSKKSGVREYAKQLEEKAAATSKKSGVREYARQLEKEQNAANRQIFKNAYGRYMEESAGTAPAAMRTYIPQPLQKNVLPVSQVGVAQTYLQGKDEKGVDVSLHEQTAVSESTQENDAYVPGSPKLPQEEIERRHRETFREGNPLYNDDRKDNAYASSRPEKDIEFELASAEKRAQEAHAKLSIYAAQQAERGTADLSSPVYQRLLEEKQSAQARVDALKAEKKDARNARITQGYKDAQAQVEADQKKYFSKESAELDKIIGQAEDQRDQHIAQSERWEAANGEKLASMKAEYEELRKKGYDVPSRLSTAQIPEYNRFLELKKEIAALEKERADLKKLTDQSTSGMYYASGAKTFSALSEDEQQTVLDYIAMLQSGLFSSGATDYTYTSFDGTQKEADYKQTSDTASAYESLLQRLKTRGISPEEIARMQKTMQALYNERARTAANAQRAKSAAEHPVLSSIGSVFTSLIGGISSGADLLLQNASNALGKGWNAAPIDFNTPATAAAAYTDTVRDTVSQKISDGNGAAGQIGAFIYQTGMSGADSALASFLGNAGGAAVLGLGAAYSAAKDAHERGATDAQAMWTGLFAGVFETLFERVSIGNLNALKETPVATVKDIFLNIAKSAGVNASEEAATEAANLISDYLINGDLSVYSENYYARIAAKESEADARKNALLDMLAQIGLAGVGGALMGVGFAGGAGAYNYTAGRRRNHTAGSLFFNENGKLNDADYSALLTEGLQSENAEIRDYAARLGEKRDGISQNEAGLLYRMLASENPESNISVDENGRIHIADTAEETARQGEVADASDSEETEEDIAFRDAIVKMDEYGNLVAKTAEDFARDREKKRSASVRAVEQEIEGAEQAISPDGAGGKLYAMLSGDVTNDTATEIINNAELASVFETATGAKLEGTLAEKRRIVKEYAEEYVNTRRANTIDQMLKRVTNAAATSFNQNNFKMALGAEGQAAFDQYRETGTAIFSERVGEDNGKVAFDAEFSMFYKMGIAGDEFAYFSDEGNSLTETQAFDVYNAGRRDARHLTASDSTEKSGIRAGASDTDIKTAQRIAKLLKRDIVFLDVENEDFNGCFKDGKIYINVNSGQSIVQIASHEFTHSLESKSAYEKLRRFVFDFYRRQGISKDALLSDKRASHEVYAELSDAELEFEVVAQFVEEKLITDESIMQRIVNTEGKAYGKTLHETFDAIIKKIKAALSGKEEKQLQSLERGRRILAEVVRSADANENVNGVKFNLGNTLGAQLDDWIAGLGKPYGAYNGKYFELGTTPDILVKHGAPRAPVIMYDDCIVKITGGKHAISLDEIAKLPAQLNDPILLFKGSVPNSFVALTEMHTKIGHDVVVAVHINKYFERTIVNKIASLHSRTSDKGKNVIVNYVNKQINDGNLLDASSKKAPIWFTSRGLQLPKLVQTIIDANNRVAQKSSDVNSNYMYSPEKDSNKNQFSAAHDERRDIFKGMSKNARENVKAAEDRLIEAAQYLGLMSDEEKPSVSLKTKLRNISLQLLSSPTDSAKLRGQTLDLISGTERGKIDETASDGFNEAFDKYIAAVSLFREDFRAARREAQAAKEKAEADNALLRDMPDFGTADYELSESSRKLTEALVFGEAEERDERSRARNAEMLEAAESARNDSSEPLVRRYDRGAEVVDDRSGYSDVTPEAAEEERKLSESLAMEEQERTYRERREANRAKNREALDALTRTAEESRKERDAAAGAVVDIEKLSERAKNYLDRAENTALRRIGGLLSVPSMAQKQILKTVVHNITSEYMNGGKLSAKAVNDLFEKAYNAGVMIDEDFYSRYENVRNFLRENKITVTEAEKSRIEDYSKFRKSVSGKMRLVKEGGISIKEAFEALQEMAPELFDTATQEKDMLRSIGNVASSLRRIEYTLDGYYGDMAEDFKADAKEKFDVIVKDTVEELNNVKRYVTGEEKKQAEREAAAKTEKTTVGLKEAYAQVKTARRAADRAEARNLLTDYDKSLVDDLLKGRKTLDDVARKKNVNHKGIREVYEAKLEYEKTAKVIREYKKWHKERLRMQADTYLKNANEWKDKQIGLLYSRESMIRNIRDIVSDESTANDLIETYFRADRTNQKINNAKNHYRGMIDKLKLSQKVMHGNVISESAAVQLLGEAEDNIRTLESNPKLGKREGKTLEEWRAVVNGLWKENPGLDAVKIKSAVATFRTIYDELFEQMNETRIRNGYEPIDYRKGYFPHFTAESGDGLLGAIGKSLGINTEVTALPTTINGLTHTFKPGIRWFGNALQRTSNETTYDAVQGFDRYIEGAAEVIYRTDDIQRLRALAEQIRYRTSDEGIRQQIDAVENDKTLSDEVKKARKDEIYENGRYSLSQFVVELEEYTNVLANKKSRYDRATESAISRNIYNITKAVESRVAANMVALNPASWLTNFVPLTQGAALLDRGMLIRGMWDALRSYKADDGMVARSAFLTNRRGSDPLVRTWSESASAALSKPMEWIDCFVADSLVRARYAQNLKDGLSEAEAMNEADLWVGQVMADRSKGMMPTVFEQRNPLTKLFTQFQLEVNNQLSFLFKDMPSEARKKGMMALVMSFVKFFVGAWLFDEAYEWLVGRRCALDPIGILNDTIGDATGYKLPNLVDLGVGAVKGELPSFKTKKKNAFDTTTGVFKNVAEELPFVGGILGGGRVPINSALPDAENLLKASLSDGWSAGKRLTTAGKELSKPLYYVAPPFGGGQLKKIYEGIKAVAQGGSYTVDANGNDILQYPVYSENASDIARNAGIALFGKSSLPTAREWVESGFDSFSAKETAAYQGAVAAGVSEREAYSLISSLGKIEKTETRSAAELKRKALSDSKISGEGKSVVYYGMMASDSEQKLMDSLDAAGADMGRVTKALIACKDAGLKKGVTASNDKRNAIRNSGLKENEKILLYRALISENRDDDIEAFRNAGLSINDFIRCQNEYAITEASYSTLEMRAASIWSWLDATYTDAQIQVIMERLGYAWIISKR